ncbi:MAG: glycosyl hydrolase-related protein [Gemmatimonadaceae bacterium]
MSTREPFDVHVVSHTHWDREWYLPLARMRQRLVALVDELVDSPPEHGAFLLDGQAIVLEDYLAVRPERADALRRLLERGVLEAGPWFVLADELLSSGESLVRNLLAGTRSVRSRGGTPPPVLYCPDSFGHPADLPALAEGFGLSLAIVWRGLGGPLWPSGDTFRWTSAGGARVLVHHLPPDGYEYAANLPADERNARDRWQRLRGMLGDRARTRVLLLLNGADHHARQSRLDDALATLTRVAAPDRVTASSLRRFSEAFAEAAVHGDSVPEISGELRSSYGYAWTVPGTWSSRTYQKRRNARAERLLTRAAEPWAAIAAARGSQSRGHLLRAAWRTLLECHPHDTLCGCSSDDIARAADARFDVVTTEGRGILEDAVLDLVGHDAAAARGARSEWRPHLLVRNASPYARSGVADVELIRFVADEPVGPGSAGVAVEDRKLPPPALAGGRVPLEVLDRRVRSHRVESPRHYPDNDRVDVARGVAWIGDVPGLGIVAHEIGNEPSSRSAHSLPVPPVRGRARSLDNGLVRVTVARSGAVRLEWLALGMGVDDAIRFDDVGDAGDLYTHSPIGPVVEGASLLGCDLASDGPLRGELRLRFAMDVPRSSKRAGRSDVSVRQNVDVALILDAGSRAVRIRVRAVNGARDHRLRIVFSTGLTGAATLADAMFAPVIREPAVQPSGTETMELASPTAPLARWVARLGDRHGMTVISDGLGEYESMGDGSVAVTLVRAVGGLSRNDLPERRGHAGWPTPTPAAQCLGPLRAEFGLVAHAAARDEAIGDIERAADDILLPLVGTTLRSAIKVPNAVSGLSLEGDGLRFLACKESEDGQWIVLRCVNPTTRVVIGAWRCGWPVRDARLSRLDEQPGDSLPVRDARIDFRVRPGEVVTVLVPR